MGPFPPKTVVFPSFGIPLRYVRLTSAGASQSWDAWGIAIKRIYESPEAPDGYRVLVDRLWPRGMTKERAALDLWMKDVAPSPQLRKLVRARSRLRFAEFRAQYIAELDANAAAEELLRICAEYPDVTLLYAAKDPQVNHALVLRDYLEDATAAKWKRRRPATTAGNHRRETIRMKGQHG